MAHDHESDSIVLQVFGSDEEFKQSIATLCKMIAAGDTVGTGTYVAMLTEEQRVALLGAFAALYVRAIGSGKKEVIPDVHPDEIPRQIEAE